MLNMVVFSYSPSTYDSFFQLPFVQATIQQHLINLLIYVPEEAAIAKWQP